MKKILSLYLLCAVSAFGQVTFTNISVGASANDGTGDNLRSMAQKINYGFTSISNNIATNSATAKLNHTSGSATNLTLVGTNAITPRSGSTSVALEDVLSVRQDVRSFGSTVSRSSIQAGITAISARGSGTLLIPKGTHSIEGQLAAESLVDLEGEGVDKTILDFTGGSNVVAILGQGSLSALPALGSNVSAGATNVTFATAHGLSEQDVFILHNTTDSSFSSASATYEDGEYFKVAQVISSTQVAVTRPAYTSHATGTSTNWKMTPIKFAVRNMTLRFKQGLGTSIAGIQIKYGEGCVIENVKASGSQYAQVYIDRCYNTYLLNSDFYDGQANIGNNYGIVVGNSQEGIVQNCIGVTTRHPFSAGGGTGDAAVPTRGWQIIGGIWKSLGDDLSINFHGNCEYNTITAVDAPSGIFLGGDHGIIQGSTIGNRNASGYAVAVFEPRGLNFSIQNNFITANRNFDLGLVSVFARSYTSAKGEALLSGNRYNFGGFNSSTYPTGSTIGVNFGFVGTPSSTDQTLIAQDETFTTASTTTGPTYAYLSSSGVLGFKNVFIDNANARGVGLASLYRNIQKVRITNSKSREALNYGVLANTVSSPTYTQQDWIVAGSIIENAKLDGLRILAATAAHDIVLKDNLIRNNGQNAGTGSSIVVVNARRLWMLNNQVGDDQASPTQTTLGIVQGVTSWYKRGNENIGLNINALSYSTSSIGTETDLPATFDSVTVDDSAYDATAWNNSLEVPTKNAIRDKIESLVLGGGGLASTDIDTSAELRAIVTDESGTGDLLFAHGNIGSGTAADPSSNDDSSRIVTTSWFRNELEAYNGNISTTGSITGNGITSSGGAFSMVIEGATADDFETTLTATDPTADNAVVIPNASGTIALVAGNIGAATATSAAASDDDTSVATTEHVKDAIAADSRVYEFALSDETTAVTTGTGKVTWRAPHAMTITAVRASVTTAPTGSTLIVDINESGTTILSTKLSIDASEKTSTTAASAAVISDTAIADDAEITFDLDQVGSTVAGAGVKVKIYYTK